MASSLPAMTYSTKRVSSRIEQPGFADNSLEAADGRPMLPMEPEVSAAVNFLRDLMIKSSMDVDQVDRFQNCLKTVMVNHYRNHWYPKIPLRGSAYRCLRINGSLDPLVAKAASMASLSANLVRLAFPVELSIWVDPGEVSVRFGEEGSIGVIHSCEPMMPPDDDNVKPVQVTPRDLQFGDSAQHLTVRFNVQQQSPPTSNMRHHVQEHAPQYANLAHMLQRSSTSTANIRLQSNEPRFTEDFNSAMPMMGVQQDSAWSNWNQPDSIGKSPNRQPAVQHHYMVHGSRDYRSLQMHHPLATPHHQLTGNCAALSPITQSVDQTPHSAVDAANNSQLSRHCRALAEQLILNGGLMWSAPSCGENGQVIETVAS